MSTPREDEMLAREACEALGVVRVELAHDPEAASSQADKIMEKFLRVTGHGDVADAWLSVPKWYA